MLLIPRAVSAKEANMTSANIRIDEATAPVRPILEIKDLAITFKTGSGGEVKAVKNAHLSIMPGETVAIVGGSRVRESRRRR